MIDENKNRRFTLRINSTLFDIIKQYAAKNKRAIGKEIEYTLEKVYTQAK